MLGGMTFTQDEIDASVGKFIRTSIRREYGALGNRRTDLTFSDVQDAAAGVFITKPKAPFYVVRLGAEKLSEYLQTVQGQVADLIELIEGTGRNVTPVDSLSPLANARSALGALTSATSSRTSSFARVEDIPAFQRFEASTQRFLDESSKNIRQDGELARTPDEARSLLGTAISTLEAQHTEVVRRAGLLAGAVSDYESMNLPQTLAGQVMQNARDVVGQRYEDLSALTPKQRLGALREATLDVLAARATVRGFGSLTPPTLFYLVDGELNVFADADHPATPASLLSDYYGPYPITDSQYELHFEVEGDSLTIPIQGSFIARIETVIVAPYDIGATNDELRISLDNYPTVGSTTNWDVPLTNGATQQIWDVVDDINGWIDPTTYPLIAEPYLQPQKWSGTAFVDQTGSANDIDFNSANPSLDFTDLDGAGLAVVAGDKVIVRSGLYDEYICEVVSVTPTQLSCDYLEPSLNLGDELLAQEIEVGKELALRLRITKETDDNDFVGAVDYQYEALRDRVAILVPKTNSVSEQSQYDTAVTLGLFPLMEARSAPTAAKTVADSMTKSILNNTWSAGVSTPRVEVTAELDPYIYEGPARTNPNNFLQVVCAKFTGVGDVGSGTAPVVFTVEGAASAGVEVGDIVVLRTTVHVGEANTYGLITLVDDTQIQASMISAVTADTNVTIEAGPNLYAINFDATVVISGDTGNEGEYLVTEIGEIPFELTINSALPFPNGRGNSPIQFTASVGHYKVRFASVDETLATFIRVDGAGASAFVRFFNPLIASRSAAGLTPYLLMPEWPAGLEEGDIFEWYNANIDTVDVSSPIVSLEQSALLVGVQDPVATDSPAVQMTVNSPIPFARIRRQTLNTYNSLTDDLNGWLDTPEASARWFNTLRPLINPLTVNTNPTPSQVNSAKVKAEEMYTSLVTLEQYLGSYEADPVDEVDTLLHAFQEKGADRATDILLEGRFSDFFGLDQNEVSYAGNMQKAIRAVQREDLPVRRDNRVTYQGSDGLLAEYDDKDFEFARDELDNDMDIELPGG